MSVHPHPSGELGESIRREASILSPLRYPGSKRRLAGYIGEALRMNGLTPRLFVEPFCGGASVSLQLLADGLVEEIALADRDPLVAAFWRTVFFDTDWLVDQVLKTEVSLDSWRNLRASNPIDDRNRAWKCLFLNRTSFSGILSRSAGPIGGMKQESAYRIDCRFPRETLSKRIQQAGDLRDKIRSIWSLSWKATMTRIRKASLETDQQGTMFFYLDPPFFFKADRLYSFWFTRRDHVAMRDYVVQIDDPWLISYDSAREASILYGPTANGATVDSLYSAHQQGGLMRRTEAVISNLEVLPRPNRVWRTKAEWKK